MAYDFDTLVERRGTSSLKWDFGRKFVGVDGLLPLWVADMDFKAPPEIVEALRRRVDHGIYGYTMEPESYFEAAQSWMRRRHGWSVQREWMIASPGVIPCLSATILALTAPGDGIIIQPPCIIRLNCACRQWQKGCGEPAASHRHPLGNGPGRSRARHRHGHEDDRPLQPAQPRGPGMGS